MEEQNSLNNTASKYHISVHVWIIIIVLLFILTAISTLYFLQTSKLNEKISNSQSQTMALRNDIAKLEQKKIDSKKEIINYEREDSQERLNVTWIEPQELSDLELVYGIETKYFKVGIINSGDFKESEIILTQTSTDNAYTNKYISYNRFIKKGEKYIFLENYSSIISTYNYNRLRKNDIVVAPYLIINDLEFPEVILDQNNNIYRIDKNSLISGSGFVNTTNWVKKFDNPFIGNIYKINKDFKDNSFDFFAKSPDNTEITYIYTPEFFKFIHTQDDYHRNFHIYPGYIKLNDNKTNTTTYIRDISLNFCGDGDDYIKSILDYPITMSNLQKIGTLKNNDAIYTLKDENNIYYQSFKSTNKKITTEPFLIIWQDDFGRLIRFVDESQLESCGG